MASTFSDLGLELMATGENAGTWGTKTNTNLQIIEKSIAGYVEQAVTSGGTTALSITDGDTTESTSVARHAVIKLTGTITGNSIVTVPDSIEKVYIVTNGTSGAYTVQFKTASVATDNPPSVCNEPSVVEVASVVSSVFTMPLAVTVVAVNACAAIVLPDCAVKVFAVN